MVWWLKYTQELKHKQLKQLAANTDDLWNIIKIAKEETAEHVLSK